MKAKKFRQHCGHCNNTALALCICGVKYCPAHEGRHIGYPHSVLRYYGDENVKADRE